MWSFRTRLKNTYGPAECSVTATGFDIHENDIDSVGNIGRGIGLVTWVVELSGDRLAAIGAIGKF